MSLERRHLQVGPLSVTLNLNAAAELCAVELPAQVPEDLDAPSLRDLCARLAAFPLCFSDAAPFTRKVWERMRQIPWGSALTYGELAAQTGDPNAVRAIGQACGRNKLLLIVPCHRVLAQSGPGGFALGPDWKQKLLELETE